MLFVALALARSDEPWAEKMISRLRRFWWLVALFAGCALCMLVQLAGSGRRLAFLQNFDITLEIEPRAPAAVLLEISAAGRGSEGLALRMSTAEPAEASRATTPPSAVAAEWGPGAGTDAVGPGTPTPQGALGLGGLAPTTSTATAGAAAPTLSTVSAWVTTSAAASEAARSRAASTEPARPEGADGATGGSGAPGPLAALPVQPLGPPAAAAPEAAGASPFCNLGVCRQHGAQAPRLFVAEHTDGAGHRMANIINGIAVAAHNRMNFGGVVAVPNSVTEQGHDFRGLVNRFFGSQDATKQLFFQSPRIKTRSPAYFALPKCPDFDAEFKKLNEMERSRPSFQDSTNVYVPSVNGVSVPRYFAPEVLSALRQPLAAHPLEFAVGRPSVALHIRRGDLTKSHARATADEYYYRVVERIRAVLPDADVHAWSSTKNILAFKQSLWSQENFQGYRERNITVHLDDGDLMDPWAHLSRASVLVMSMSSFSYVPAVLNPHCVIYAGSVSGTRPNWVNGFDERPYGANLEACIHQGYGDAPGA